jgi:transposase
MDNAKIHHGADVTELCEQFGESRFDVFSCLLADFSLGVRVEYLPPYSPDFQPIEEAFSKLKAFLRRHRTYYSQTIGDGILFDMYEITEIITPEDAAGYFMHAGYF